MRSLRAIACCLVAFALIVLFDSCPTEPAYSSTITPIYAATDDGLFVYNGSSWTQYSTSLPSSASSHLASNTARSVVVSGSGSQADIYVGTGSGVSHFDGSSWKNWSASDGLGTGTVNQLFLTSSDLYAATSSSLSFYNYDGISPVWNTNSSISAINAFSVYGTYIYVAAGSLYVYNGTSLQVTLDVAQYVPGSTKATSILPLSSQETLVGTDKGFNLLYSTSGGSNYSSWSTAVTKTGTVYGFALDASDNVYIACDAGIYELVYSNSSLVQINATKASCVAVDGKGTIYAGTGSGLLVSRNSGATWSNILANHVVNSVAATAPLYSF
jgi:hypothetical protein